MENAYLAFDLGASSGRVMLRSLVDGHLALDEVYRFRTPLYEKNGHLYWDLRALWGEMRHGLEQALEQASQLRSLSVDSWPVDYVPLDGSGMPLRDAYCCRDTLTHGRLRDVFDVMPAPELYERTGIQMLEINTFVQLTADLHEEPQCVAETEQRLEIVPPGTVLGPLGNPEVNRDGSAPVVEASCSHDAAAAVAAVPAEENTSWAYLSSGTWSLMGVELEDLLGHTINVLQVVGGGAQNDLLCQWTADACGCRAVAGPAEATAFGNLLVQARALGYLADGDAIRDVVRRSCELRNYEPTGGWATPTTLKRGSKRAGGLEHHRQKNTIHRHGTIRQTFRTRRLPVGRRRRGRARPRRAPRLPFQPARY